MPPKPKSPFVAWIERTIRLPIGLAAEPGKIRLPIYLREIAAPPHSAPSSKIPHRH
jgi:hypothetical protein